MNEKAEKFLKLFEQLQKNKFTGEITLNFHEGNLSKKIHTSFINNLGSEYFAFIETK